MAVLKNQKLRVIYYAVIDDGPGDFETTYADVPEGRMALAERLTGVRIKTIKTVIK